jgi:NTE family protein
MAKGTTATPSPIYERVALVLQGGGALGAYQVGVYAALEEAGYMPDWVAGTSIGAINAAIIAGNPPGRRLEKLEAFWKRIATPELWPVRPSDGPAQRMASMAGSWHAVAFGQPGFFRPRVVNPWLARPGSPGAVSFYDTDSLRGTLADLVDFDRINGRETRLSLGTVHVTTGRQVYFDNARDEIGVDHIMASGALPPGFPPVVIEGEPYWDGGILSNTPLDIVLDDTPRVSTLCFVADLFDPVGPEPATMDEVMARHKDIAYASRTRGHIEGYRATHNLRRAVNALWQQLPAELRNDPEMMRLLSLGSTTTMNIVHFIYRGGDVLISAKDYDFSAGSLARHRAAGYRDAAGQIARHPWQASAPSHVGVVVHELPAAAE